MVVLWAHPMVVLWAHPWPIEKYRKYPAHTNVISYLSAAMLPFAVSTAATCYYYYAAFNAPCVGHEDDEAHMRLCFAFQLTLFS